MFLEISHRLSHANFSFGANWRTDFISPSRRSRSAIRFRSDLLSPSIVSNWILYYMNHEQILGRIFKLIALSANQISSLRVSANHRATSKYQFETSSN